MQNLDLRPLSLGEILDRTFTLYKNNFVLFAGISMIPHLLVLAFQMLQVFIVKLPQMPAPHNPPDVATQWQAAGGDLSSLFAGVAVTILLFIIGVIVYVVALLLSNGATVLAVSELYMGRSVTIAEALRRVRSSLLPLLALSILTGLACMAGFIFLIIPGVYIACRLSVAVPSTVIEDLGAPDAMSRSFDLTKEFAGRAFLIYLLYFALLWSAIGLFQLPFMIGWGWAMAKHDLGMFRFWSALMQIGSFVANVLVTPVLTIASSIFYYDLRVRKEAFDLQVMMGNEKTGFSGPASIPSMLT